ncbi:MAG: hypothetical protein MJ156_01645 [Alphaproteobacteria bacterium]|nr:hypothetical protein [Alphaproteobacteria bacterium]
MAKTTKKTVAKKTTTKKVAAAKKVAPVVETPCTCGCHKHSAVKKILLLLMVFALGFVCAKMTSAPCPMHKAMMQKHRAQHPVFTNGCLDMQSIKNTKLLEVVAKADVNNDGCISIEEYKAARKEMFKNYKHQQQPVEK